MRIKALAKRENAWFTWLFAFNKGREKSKECSFGVYLVLAKGRR